MKLGVNEPKKLILLAALVVGGGYLKFSDMLSSPASSSAPAAVAPPAQPFPTDVPTPSARVVARSRVQSDEFHPVLHSKRPEDRIDPARIDPTLRLDLLAKVRGVDASGPGRNVFQFGPPPVKAAAPTGPEPRVMPKPITQVVPVSDPSKPAGPPPPPPITLKYYGFSSAQGGSTKTAFFLDGDEILVAKEGDTVKRRYRVVRVGATSVVMEDTESKRQQTLPLEEVAG